MEFKYYYQTTAFGNINIDDIGNCILEANDDMGCFYYLIIETHLGVTTVFTYGPILIDKQILPKMVNCRFNRMAFTERKCITAIETFLNPRGVILTQVNLLENKEEALKNCISIIEYVRKGVDFN